MPRTTLRNKLSGRTADKSGVFGPKPELGEVEAAIVSWIEDCAKAGFPVNKQVLLNSVQLYVKKESLNTPLKMAAQEESGSIVFDSAIRIFGKNTPST